MTHPVSYCQGQSVTNLDNSEEKIAEAVLNRLGDMSLRDMEGEAAVSRGTLNR